jgi:hypothetical protein
MNPELQKGDRVVVLKMSDPYSAVPPGTAGTVLSSSNVFGDDLYYVDWDNGSRLNLISGEDIWLYEEDFNNRRKRRTESVKPKKKLTESQKSMSDFVLKNRQILKNYDWKKIKLFLTAIRATSIVNMLESGYFLSCGKERLEHFITYKNISNKKALKYALEHADEVRNVMISGAMSMLEDEDKEITPQSVERRMRRDTSTLMQIYMSFPMSKEFDSTLDDEDEDEDYYEDGYEDEEDEDDDY